MFIAKISMSPGSHVLKNAKEGADFARVSKPFLC